MSVRSRPGSARGRPASRPRNRPRAAPPPPITLGQPDNGTNPTSDSSRRAYDLISQGFGPGANGPLAVVVQLPKQSSSDNQSLLNQMTPGPDDPGALDHGLAGRAGLVDAALDGADRPATAA